MKSHFLSLITDFLFPPICHICGDRLSGTEKFICPECCQQLPRTLYDLTSPNPMELRFAGLFPFERATAAFFYSRNSALSKLVQDFKYNNFPSLAVKLGEIAANELIDTGFFNNIDILMPVPMHFFKKASRGYNQAERIAQGISNATGLPVFDNLVATQSHKTQTALSREQRIKNLEGVFRIKKYADISGKHILLVDDICTTGSTLSQAATVLTQDSNTKLSIFTLATTF